MGGRGSSGGKGSRNSNINNSNEFKSGDIVRIKPEFCDTPSEADNIYFSLSFFAIAWNRRRKCTVS